MLPIRFVLAAIFVAFLSSAASAQFSGTLEMVPKGCEALGQCILKNAFRFTDASNTVWEAREGLPTDGASIPGIFQPFVGSPFDPAFIKAAVIHDHYCDRHVKPWRQTHKVFYEGLIASGVSRSKAKTMYFAVFLGGPKWIELEPGVSCGTNCINKFKSTSGVAGFYSRRADYSASDVGSAVQSVGKLLELNPDVLSLEELENMAEKIRPKDFFYANGAKIDASVLGVTE